MLRTQPHRSLFKVVSSCLQIPYGVKSTAESCSNTPYRQLIAVAAGDRALNINGLFFEDNLTFFNLFSRIESPIALFSSMIKKVSCAQLRQHPALFLIFWHARTIFDSYPYTFFTNQRNLFTITILNASVFIILLIA